MMLIRMVKTGEQRKVTAEEARRLIETKQAVPVLRRDIRTAVISDTRLERR